MGFGPKPNLRSVADCGTQLGMQIRLYVEGGGNRGVPLKRLTTGYLTTGSQAVLVNLFFGDQIHAFQHVFLLPILRVFSTFLHKTHPYQLLLFCAKQTHKIPKKCGVTVSF